MARYDPTSALRGFFAEQDIVALDVHLETFHAVRGLGQAVPVGHVKFVGLHGAADDAAAKRALPQGPVLVRTGVVDGVIAAVHVEKGPPAARSH